MKKKLKRYRYFAKKVAVSKVSKFLERQYCTRMPEDEHKAFKKIQAKGGPRGYPQRRTRRIIKAVV